MGASNSIVDAKASAFAAQGTDMPLWALEVIQYCSWETRAAIHQLSRKWRRNTQTPHYFRFLCTRLAAENGIYVPKNPPPSETWKSLFLELYKLKHLWNPSAQMTPSMNPTLRERFKISVYAKFRPLTEKIAENEGTEHDEKKTPHKSTITLPLHQRLAMIRMSHKVKNNREALKMLAEEGAWFQAKWSSLANTIPEETIIDNNCTDDKENQQAFTTNELNTRMAAQSSYMISKHQALSKQKHHKKAVGDDPVKIVAKVHSLDTMNGRVVMITPDIGLREFSYDSVLPTNTSQKQAYDVCTKRLVMDMLNGFNATTIVYGQTGKNYINSS